MAQRGSIGDVAGVEGIPEAQKKADASKPPGRPRSLGEKLPRSRQNRKLVAWGQSSSKIALKNSRKWPTRAKYTPKGVFSTEKVSFLEAESGVTISARSTKKNKKRNRGERMANSGSKEKAAIPKISDPLNPRGNEK